MRRLGLHKEANFRRNAPCPRRRALRKERASAGGLHGLRHQSSCVSYRRVLQVVRFTAIEVMIHKSGSRLWEGTAGSRYEQLKRSLLAFTK